MSYLLSPYDVQISGEAERSDLIVSVETHKPLITPSTDHSFVSDCRSTSGNRIVCLPIDLIRACSERLEAIMNPRVAFMYKVVTRSHCQYKMIPSWLRNRFLRKHDLDFDLSRHLASERARNVLKSAFSDLGLRFERKNSPSLMITHDIENKKGLMRALALKAVEDKLGIRSTWFLTSDEYPIPLRFARELGDGSVIGSHDVKHDGRLIYVEDHQALVERLGKSKAKLETLFERDVECFRSPLLQFSRRIARALGKSGYRFDYSIPCWEPVHPVTMSGFGIESVQPFDLDGVTEFPLTLFQDHQVLNVIGMDTNEATRLWIQQAKLIRMFGGDIVLLIHPDYAFSQHLEDYRELLRQLLEIHSSTEHVVSQPGGSAGNA